MTRCSLINPERYSKCEADELRFRHETRNHVTDRDPAFMNSRIKSELHSMVTLLLFGLATLAQPLSLTDEDWRAQTA